MHGGQNLDDSPDLNKANLGRAVLSGASLSGAVSRQADLERLTKPSLDEAPGDEGCGEGQEGEVDVGASLVADDQAPELAEPGQRALHHFTTHQKFLWPGRLMWS